MSDILADYREWRDQQAARVSTHSGGCHMWHKDCMIHRLAAALERAISGAGKSAQAANTPPALTDEEREAIERAIGRELDAEWYGGTEPERVTTLRTLLERTK
jgi:hypothetical protein